MQIVDVRPEIHAALDYDRQFLTAVLDARFPGRSPTGRIAADLSLIQLVIDNGPYADDPVEELEALGTCFGDLLAADLGLHWVICRDADGEELGLRYGEHASVIFPREVFVDAARQGDDIEVHALFEELSNEVREMIEAERHR
jgi:hypothetical protein